MSIDLQEAAAVLKEHFGARLEAGEAEGRQLMADVLQEKLLLAAEEAEQLITALEQAQTVRWVEVGQSSSLPQAMMPFAEATGAQAPGGPATSAEVAFGGGYWQL